MKDYVVLDLETTGFSPQTNEIIEIGAYKIKDGVVVGKFCTFVRPSCYIPLNVQNITGIKMSDVEDANPIEEVIVEFFEFCEDLPFLGHNLSFDYNFLVEKGNAVGLDFTLGRMRQGIDTCNLAKKYLKLTDNKLHTVYEHFNINIGSPTQFHRASFDAYATKLIYDRFLLYNNNMPGVTIPELLDKSTVVYGKARLDDVLPLE